MLIPAEHVPTDQEREREKSFRTSKIFPRKRKKIQRKVLIFRFLFVTASFCESLLLLLSLFFLFLLLLFLRLFSSLLFASNMVVFLLLLLLLLPLLIFFFFVTASFMCTLIHDRKPPRDSRRLSQQWNYLVQLSILSISSILRKRKSKFEEYFFPKK